MVSVVSKKRDMLMFKQRFQCEFGWSKVCKNNNLTCLFHCINTCRVSREMFGHSAYWPHVQTDPPDLANVNA